MVFEPGTQQFILAETADEFCVDGPSASILGWIPKLSMLRAAPDNEYKRHRGLRLRCAFFPLLFASGNPEPPHSFPGGTEFSEFLTQREFRGALALDNVRLHCDKYSRPVRISFRALGEVGYTPFRLPLGKTTYSQGVLGQGGGRWKAFELLDYGQGVRTQGTIVFKVGRLPDWMGKNLTGRYLPYVQLGIEYTLRTDGACKVGFFGTAIPSEQNYGNWVTELEHDMLGNTVAQIDGFLAAGPKGGILRENAINLAPITYRGEWIGTGKKGKGLSGGL